MDTQVGTEKSMTMGRILRRVGLGALAFAATAALLGPWSGGPSRAVADDPGLAPADPMPVVQGFAPALADGQVVPAGPVALNGATVRAWLAKNEQGAASIVVELHGPERGKSALRCRVALNLVEFPDASPMMRMLPEPQITELVSKELVESVGAGETRTATIPVPGDRLARLEGGTDAPMTHGQITIEALDAP